jgi:hypothetical protein
LLLQLLFGAALRPLSRLFIIVLDRPLVAVFSGKVWHRTQREHLSENQSLAVMGSYIYPTALLFGFITLLALGCGLVMWLGAVDFDRAIAWTLLVGYVLFPIAYIPDATAMRRRFLGEPHGYVHPNPGVLLVRAHGTRLLRWRRTVTRYLAPLIEVAVWPAAHFSKRTLHTVGTGSARALRPRLAAYAITSALLALALVGLRWALGSNVAITAAASALLVALMARHVLWLVSGGDFVRLLKRSLGRPYLTLALLAGFDYVALLAIAILLLRWHAGANIHLGWLWLETRDILALHHLTQLLHRSLTPAVVAVALASAAYYTSLAAQLVRFQSFARDDEDKAYVAAMLLAQGDKDAAEGWLSDVSSEHLSATSLQAKIRMELARREYDTAFELARLMITNLDPSHNATEGGMVYLATQLRWTVVDRDGACMAVLGRARKLHICDAATAAIIRSLAPAGAFGCHPDWLTSESYPLAMTALELYRGDDRSFQQQTPPGLDLIDGVYFEAVLTVDYVARNLTFESDAPEMAKRIEVLTRVLSSASPESLPFWLREIVIQATWRIEKRARMYGVSGYQELHAARRRLLLMSPQAAEAHLTEYDNTETERVRASVTGWLPLGPDI